MFFNKYRLEDITDKIGDGIHGTPEYDDNGDFYFVNGNNLVHGDIVFKNDTKRINEEQYLKNKRDLNKNTLLVSINGTLGNVAKYNNEKIILGKSACYINVKDEYNVDYVYFVFESPKFKKYLQYGANGTTIKNVPLSAIRNYEILIPSKENQDKIVKILKSIEDKIKLNNKINNNLQELAKSIYYEKFKDKTKNGKLKDILDLHKKSIKSKDESLKYFPIDVLPMNYLITRDGKTNEEAQSSLVEFKKYDILVGAMRVYFHRVCLAAEDGITRTTTFVLRPKNEDYLYYSLITLDKDDFIKYANDGSKGSTMPYAVWDNNCNEYEIYVPTSNEAKEFNDIVKSLFEIQIINEKNNRYLEQLRDTLLPKLMTGEIDLDNIEI